MIVNFAIAGGFIVSISLIIVNISSLAHMKKAYQADLFFKLTMNMDALFKEQTGREREGQLSVENWYERLLNAFEDFGYFANRKLIPKDMIDHHVSTIIAYCKSAPEYSENLKKKLINRKPKQYSEIQKLYKKRTSDEFPF